jgi:hypothetical protein
VTDGGIAPTTEHVPRVCPRTSSPHSRATLVREPSSRRSTLRTAMQSFTACRRRGSQRRALSASRGSSRCASDTRRFIRDVRRSQAPAREGLRRRLGRKSREPRTAGASRTPKNGICSASVAILSGSPEVLNYWSPSAGTSLQALQRSKFRQFKRVSCTVRPRVLTSRVLLAQKYRRQSNISRTPIEYTRSMSTPGVPGR